MASASASRAVPRPWRAGRLNVSVGSQVVAGQEFARLDTHDLATTLELERAKLANLQAAETLNADCLSVDNTKASFPYAQKQLTEQKRVSESNIVVAERQLQQVKSELWTCSDGPTRLEKCRES